MDKELNVLNTEAGKQLLGYLINKYKVADSKVNVDNANAMYVELGQKSVIRHLLNEIGMDESGIEKLKNVIKYGE